MWKKCLLLLFALFYFLTMSSVGFSQNTSDITLGVNVANFTFNITEFCQPKCILITGEILNITFAPQFRWYDPFNKLNCTVTPHEGGMIQDDWDELTCRYLKLNFTTQEEFDKGMIPITIGQSKQNEKLIVDYTVLQKLQSENPVLWFVIGFESLAIIGYIVWQKYDEARSA